MDSNPTYEELLKENRALKASIEQQDELIFSLRQKLQGQETDLILGSSQAHDQLLSHNKLLKSTLIKAKIENEKLKDSLKTIFSSRIKLLRTIDNLSTKIKVLHASLCETRSNFAVSSKSYAIQYTRVLFLLIHLISLHSSPKSSETEEKHNNENTLANSFLRLYRTNIFYNFHQSSIPPLTSLLSHSHSHAESTAITLVDYINTSIFRIFPKEHLSSITQAVAKTGEAIRVAASSQKSARRKKSDAAKSRPISKVRSGSTVSSTSTEPTQLIEHPTEKPGITSTLLRSSSTSSTLSFMAATTSSKMKKK